MLFDLLTAIGSLGAIMTLWITFQGWVRKTTPNLPDDCDVLQGRFGCFGCGLSDRCSTDDAIG